MISSLGNLFTTLMVALDDLVGQFSYLAAFSLPKFAFTCGVHSLKWPRDPVMETYWSPKSLPQNLAPNDTDSVIEVYLCGFR